MAQIIEEGKNIYYECLERILVFVATKNSMFDLIKLKRNVESQVRCCRPIRLMIQQNGTW